MNTLLPTTKTFYYSYLQDFGKTEEGNKKAYALSWDFWLSLLALGFFSYVALTNAFGFAFGLWILFSLQWSNFVTYTQLLTDRYCSVPAIFLMYFLANCIGYCIEPYCTILFTYFATAYAVKTASMFRMYKDLEQMLNYCIFNFPKNIDAYYYKGKSQFDSKDYVGSLATFKDGLRYNPTNCLLNHGIASCLYHLNPSEGLRFIQIAEDNITIGEDGRLGQNIRTLKKNLLERLNGKS